MATQRRPITGDEFYALWQLGVLGEKVELLDGWIVYGDYPFAFSEEAAAAARAAGIELGDPDADGDAVEVDHGARPARSLTAAEYDRLIELGVLGEQVELIDGRIVSGRFPFVFSGEAIAAARAAGIELDPPEQGPGYRLAALGTPPAASDDAEALALAALIEHADTATLTRAERRLARAGAERNDPGLLAAADRLREAREQRPATASDDRAHRDG